MPDKVKEENKKFIKVNIQQVVTAVITAMFIGAFSLIIGFYNGRLDNMDLEIEKLKAKYTNLADENDLLRSELKLVNKDLQQHKEFIEQSETFQRTTQRDIFKMDKEVTAVDVRMNTIHGRE